MKALQLIPILLIVSNIAYARNIWFGDIKSPLSLNDNEIDQVFAYIKRPQKVPFPTNDTSPRIVFVSHSKPFHTARIYMGSGLGLRAAINDALYAMPGSPPSSNDWLKLDIVESSDRHNMQSADIGNYDTSLYGLAFPKTSNIAFLPEEIGVHRLVDEDNSLNSSIIREYLDTRPMSGPLLSKPDCIYRFLSRNYFHSNNKTEILYRGNRRNHGVSPDNLLSEAVNIGSYLSANIDEKGKFNYLYQADKNTYASGYNILRHAGSIISLLELNKHNGGKKISPSTIRAIAYLVSHIKSCKPPFNRHTFSCVVHDNKIKLGGNALAIIAIARYIELTGDRRYLDKITQLGRWMIETQTTEGRFAVHKQDASSGEISDFISEYYPGEAALALIELYKVTGDDTWLNSAVVAAQYIIKQQSQLPTEELPHDHWLMYALFDLYLIKPEQIYLDHSKKLSRAIISKQNLNPSQQDWLGSYYTPPRSTPTATRTEGLIAAYKLFSHAGDAYKSRLLPHISEGVSFLLKTRYSEPIIMYLPQPRKAQNGIRRSLTSHEIRIDYCQHAISALLGHAELIKQIRIH
jgi:hypothetical protein